MINKYIISTTINTPTDAIKKFDSLKDWKLIVAGDLKTPSNYKLKNGIYLNPRDQEKISKKLSDLIGWNCIQRRNFAMIVAYKKGADLIATIDDDNIPLPNWGKNLLIEKKIKIKKFITKEHAFDPLSVTNYSHLWHRGFPLQILKNKNKSNKIKKVNESFDIQADFWNGDPDIDAICRMEHSPECRFKDKIFPFKFTKSNKKLLESADLYEDKSINKKRDAYTYRHTYISWAVIRGESLVSIAKNVGNSPATIEKHYINFLNASHFEDSLSSLEIIK